jgi:hypothetical protein
VKQTALLESFKSARHRALQATDTDVEGNIVEPSFHTAALEERGPHNPPSAHKRSHELSSLPLLSLAAAEEIQRVLVREHPLLL